jgi:hypothetical protein
MIPLVVEADSDSPPLWTEHPFDACRRTDLQLCSTPPRDGRYLVRAVSGLLSPRLEARKTTPTPPFGSSLRLIIHDLRYRLAPTPRPSRAGHLSRVGARREPSFGVDCRRAWTGIRYERSVFDDCPRVTTLMGVGITVQPGIRGPHARDPRPDHRSPPWVGYRVSPGPNPGWVGDRARRPR